MIEIGSKWQDKDGGVYTIYSTIAYSYEGSFKIREKTPVVWYKDQKNKTHVDTIEDFLDSFKPYDEPVYEYRYALDFEHLGISDSYYLDDKDFKAKNQLTKKFQRLDFTRRERK